MENDSVIHAEWLRLKDGRLLGCPLVQVKGSDHTVIRLKEIKHYDGYDSKGTYFQLDKFPTGAGKRFGYAERIMKKETGDCVVLYTEVQKFNGWNQTPRSISNYYQMDEGSYAKLSYRNVRNETVLDPQARRFVRKAGQIRVLQFVSLATGLTLVSKVILENSDPLDEAFMEPDEHALMVTGGILLSLSVPLEGMKTEMLKKALRSCHVH
ncbi:MAG: hypothetical protein R2751_05750 [Bacteroidales bacterium]